MNDEHKRRARAAEIRRQVQKGRTARAAGFHGKKIAEDLFEQLKVKMVMRIYGVSGERAKAIIAKRAAEAAAREAENRTRREKSVGNSRRRVRSNDDEWIPMEDIIGMEVGEPED